LTGFEVDPLLVERSLTALLSRANEGRDLQAEVQEFRKRCALLTQREREVMTLLVEGLSTKLIAHHLGIGARTAEHHRAAVMEKMQARTISHLDEDGAPSWQFKGADNSAK
jgi:two-component system response regulator FixJ